MSQGEGLFDAIDLNTFKTVRKFVPDEFGDRVGHPMCLEYFKVHEAEYLLVGYDSGQLLLKLLDDQSEITNKSFCRFCKGV